METIYERVGALDVHKAQVTACVRAPGPAGAREPQLAEFSTTVAGLMALRDWLAAYRVTHVGDEATGVYWQPVWAHPGGRFRADAGATPGTSSRSRAVRPTSPTRSGCAS